MKKPAAKKRAPAKKAALDSDMSDEDFGLKSQPTKKKTKKASDNEDDWDALVNPKKKAAPKVKIFTITKDIAVRVRS